MIIQTNGFIKTKGADFYKVLIIRSILTIVNVLELQQCEITEKIPISRKQANGERCYAETGSVGFRVSSKVSRR